jgi:hypothetical protein
LYKIVLSMAKREVCGQTITVQSHWLEPCKFYNLIQLIQFYSCSIISTTGKVTSQIKSCTPYHAFVIKYKQISMKHKFYYCLRFFTVWWMDYLEFKGLTAFYVLLNLCIHCSSHLQGGGSIHFKLWTNSYKGTMI